MIVTLRAQLVSHDLSASTRLLRFSNFSNRCSKVNLLMLEV